MQVNDIVRHFADWCAIHADEEPSDQFYQDYADNHTVVYDDGWYKVIDVRLGAFDHGAGNALLIVQADTQWIAYEGEMTLFAEGMILKNTHHIDPPDDQAHHNH